MQKKFLSGLVVFITGMMFFVSCSKDTVVQPTSNIPPSLKISFNDTIQPIFTSNCSNSSCHGGTQVPNLSVGHSYSSLTTGNYINIASPTSSIIYVDMETGGIMSNHCTSAQANLVLAWIKQGALNN